MIKLEELYEQGFKWIHRKKGVGKGAAGPFFTTNDGVTGRKLCNLQIQKIYQRATCNKFSTKTLNLLQISETTLFPKKKVEKSIHKISNNLCENSIKVDSYSVLFTQLGHFFLKDWHRNPRNYRFTGGTMERPICLLNMHHFVTDIADE